MANSIKKYVFSATHTSNTAFPAPNFMTGRQSDIKVKVGKEELQSTQYSLGTNQGGGWEVKFNTGFLPNEGDSIRIYRQTGHDGRLVDFVDGSLLTSETLDLNSDQLFNIAIEAYDKGDEATIGSESFYYSQGTDPNDDVVGDVDTGTLWYDTSNTPFTLKVWSGTDWEQTASAKTVEYFTNSDLSTYSPSGTAIADGNGAALKFASNSGYTSASNVYLNGVKLKKSQLPTGIPTHGDYWYDSINDKLGVQTLGSSDELTVENFSSSFSSAVFNSEAAAAASATAAEDFKDDAEDFKNDANSYKQDASDYASDATKYAINPKDQTFTTSNGIGGQYSAKHYAETAAGSATTASSAANNTQVQTVGTDLALGSNSKIKKVSDDINDVTAVAGKLTEIDSLAGKTSEMTTLTTGSALSDINTVAGKATEVGQVAAIDSEIADVAQKLSEIDAVEAKLDDIEDVAEVATKVSDVAGIIPDITTVASDPYKSKIETVYTHRDTITDVGGEITKVTTVADDLNGANTIGTLADPTYKLKVTDVANQIGAVETVSASINNNDIGTVVSNMDNIGTVVSNIADVQNAWDNANTASVSATTASNKADEASIEASNALSYSNTAAGHANTSLTNKNAAQSAQAAAELARSVAQTAKDEAESASASALSYKDQASASEGNAAASASSAATSASNAATSESNAAASESQAEVYMNTSNAWGSFYQKRYLGDKSSNPSVDNAGNALQNGALYFNTSDNTMYVYNGSTWVAAQSTINNVNYGANLAANLNTNNHDISFGDNDKANFGAGNDLQIYHDGSNNQSYIAENGIADLLITTNGAGIKLQKNTGENMIKALTDGAVTLYHDNQDKLSTTSTGIDVTGSVTNLNESGGSVLNFQQGGSGKAWIANRSYGFHDGNGLAINTTNANPIRFGTNNTEKMRITSTGNVGIGTSSPSYPLHVKSTSGVCRILAETAGITDSSQASIQLKTPTDNWQLVMKPVDSALQFYDGGASAERMRIDSSGRVLVGTASVGYAGVDLTVGDTADSQNGLAIQTSTTGNGYLLFGDGSGAAAYRGQINYKHGDDYMAFHTANAERLRIDSSGNVGIGTSSPATALDISQSNARGAYLRSSTTGSRMHFLDATTSSITTVGIGAEGNNLVLHGGGAEFMRVASSGKVGIGTSSPAEKLEVQGRVTVSNSYGYRIGATSSGDAHVGDLTNTSGVLTLRTEGNRSIRFDTAGSERVRLDHTGNLLVGTSSTSIASSGSRFFSGGNASITSAGTPFEVNRLSTNGNIIALKKNGASVGSIGTDSNSQLMIGSGDTGLSFQSNNDAIIPRNTSGAARTGLINLGTSGAQFKDLYLSGNVYTDEGFYGNRVWNEDNSSLRFATNNSEKMRIDESGNLLVGKTSADINTMGHQFLSDASGDYAAHTSRATRALLLNRKSDGSGDYGDGEIVDFRKDGVNVGSIGSQSGNLYIEDADAGLRFSSASDEIAPCGSFGANRDNALNLGASNNRFKDLYLSGGVYLGGTGSANKLDDYEEGTWTPTLIGSTGGSATMTVARNNYTKVGNMCTAYMYVNAVDTTGSFSGDVRIGGLPFAAGNNFEQAVTVTYCNLFNFDEADRTVSGYVSGTQIWLHNGSSNATVSTSNLNSASNGVTMLAVTYRTA